MNPSIASDEALFARFRATQDCDALGQLFARRAAELLRLAVFLAPRPSEAEDLLQATFLSAIAHADQFHGEARVMPWLCGILTNHARMLRRALARKLPDPLSELSHREPLHDALQRELSHALHSAIASLQEPYRSVLDLHLRLGLDQKEISERLARPHATVRKQMQRGLQTLRAALPVGLAAAFLSRLSPAQIAAQAAESARWTMPCQPTTGNPTATWGWHTLCLGLAATVFLGLGLYRGLPDHTVAPAASAAQESNRVAPNTAQFRPDEARSSDANFVNRSQPSLPTLHLATSDSLGPAPGVRLVIAPVGTAAGQRDAELYEVTTDEKGQAKLPLPIGEYTVQQPIRAALQHVLVDANGGTLQLRVPDLQPLAVRVQHASGAPAVAATVHLTESLGRLDLAGEVGRTDAAGWLQSQVRFRRGYVFAQGSDAPLSAVQAFTANAETELVLPATQRTLTFHITDNRSGTNLAGSIVACLPRDVRKAQVPRFATTDQAGQCTIPTADLGECCVLVSCAGYAPTLGVIAANHTACPVSLQPAASLSGSLFDAQGNALEQQLVRITPLLDDHHAALLPLLVRSVRTNAAGEFSLAGLPNGRAKVQAMHQSVQGPDWLPANQFVLAGACIELAHAQPAHVVLRTTPPRRLQGELRDPAGAPLAGWRIVAFAAEQASMHRAGTARACVVNSDGSFALHGLNPLALTHVAIYPPNQDPALAGVAPHAVRNLPIGEAPLLLTVERELPQHAVHGQFLLPDGHAVAHHALTLESLAVGFAATLRTQADGSWRVAGLAPGEYLLTLRHASCGVHTSSVVVTEAEAMLQLPPLHLHEGLAVTCSVASAGAPTPARVVVQQRNGVEVASGLADAQGRLALKPLQPGEYQVLVHGPGLAPVTCTMRCAEPSADWQFDLAAAPSVLFAADCDDSENHFVTAGPLEVELFDQAGTRILHDQIGAPSSPRQFRFGTGLPPGNYLVRCSTIWGACGEQEFTVQAQQAVSQVRVTLTR